MNKYIYRILQIAIWIIGIGVVTIAGYFAYILGTLA